MSEQAKQGTSRAGPTPAPCSVPAPVPNRCRSCGDKGHERWGGCPECGMAVETTNTTAPASWQKCLTCDECCPDCAADIKRLREQVTERDAELLRVRTTGHGAAHELDNIAVESGLGSSPRPGEIAEYVRSLRKAIAPTSPAPAAGQKYHCPTCGAFPVPDSVIEAHDEKWGRMRMALNNVTLLAVRLGRAKTPEKHDELLRHIRRIAAENGIEFSPLRADDARALADDLERRGERPEGM